MPIALNGTTGIDTPGINAGNIVGQVCFFAMQTAPTGFLACSGQAVSRTTYAALFAAIGTTYGAGDGSTTFNLPDLRGEFIRGWDAGRGVDSGRVFGSAQAQDFQSHTHTATIGNQTTGAWQGPFFGTFTVSAGTTTSVNSTGGTETRPRNVALLPCIKF